MLLMSQIAYLCVPNNNRFIAFLVLLSQTLYKNWDVPILKERGKRVITELRNGSESLCSVISLFPSALRTACPKWELLSQSTSQGLW